MELMVDVFDSVNLIEFRLSMQEDNTHHIGLVHRNLITAQEYQVRIPKEAYQGSYFGTWYVHMWSSCKRRCPMQTYGRHHQIVSNPQSHQDRDHALFLVD